MKFDQNSVFFDFDGVIKESVQIKEKHSKSCLNTLAKFLHKIREHHKKHIGMSRFEKIPLYLSWVAPSYGEEIISQYIENFSNIVNSEGDRFRLGVWST